MFMVGENIITIGIFFFISPEIHYRSLFKSDGTKCCPQHVGLTGLNLLNGSLELQLIPVPVTTLSSHWRDGFISFFIAQQLH